MDISVRNIEESDLEKIMYWRMDRELTRYMNTDPVLTLDIQKAWFYKISNDRKYRYWMIEIDQQPAGVVSLDINWKEKTAVGGYYIGEKELRSLIVSLSIKMSLFDHAFHVLGLEHIFSNVFSLNKAMVSICSMCGMHVDKEVNGEVSKNGVSYDVMHFSISSDEWEKIRGTKQYYTVHFDAA